MSESIVAAAGRGDVSAMERMIDSGVDIDKFIGGETALHCAAFHGQVGATRLLVQMCNKIDPKNENGSTPLMVACNTGGTKGSQVALLLINSGADVNCVRNADEMTPLKFSMRRASPELIRALIENGAAVDGPHDTKQTALMIAALENNRDAAQILIDNGADIDYPCGLAWAAGATAERIAVEAKSNSVVNLFRSCSGRKRLS